MELHDDAQAVVDNETLELLRAATRLADLGNARTPLQMRLHRALQAGRLSKAACKAYAAAQTDRTGASQLAFLRAWAEGKIKMLRPRVRQSATKTTYKKTNNQWGWFNWNELMKELHGFSDPRQEAYVETVWTSAKRDRAHPAGHPRQRWCYVGSRFDQGENREQATSVDVAGEISDPEQMQDVLEAVLKPGRGADFLADEHSSKPPAKKARRAPAGATTEVEAPAGPSAGAARTTSSPAQAKPKAAAKAAATLDGKKLYLRAVDQTLKAKEHSDFLEQHSSRTAQAYAEDMRPTLDKMTTLKGRLESFATFSQDELKAALKELSGQLAAFKKLKLPPA